MSSRARIVSGIIGLFSAGAAALAACSSGDTSAPATSASVASGLTYYGEVKTIVDAKCTTCHYEGGLGPFALETAEQVIAHKADIKAAVVSRVMPPWPPGDGCNEYKDHRALDTHQIDAITSWVDAGAPMGERTAEVAAAVLPARGLSRTDIELRISEPYTPSISPDEYRCFVLDWPETAVKYVTGFDAAAGVPGIVHHAIAYLATPDQAAKAQELDDADPGLGYTCFGGARLGSSFSTGWLGAWVPGAKGGDFPAGTGIKVLPGSKVVLQVHYNTLSTPASPDVTTVRFKTDDTVEKEAFVMPWANPQWLSGGMKIPANAPDTKHRFAIDPTAYASFVSNGVLKDGSSMTVYAAGLHMHLHGTQARANIVRANGANECVLDIPSWDFHWQGSYELATPTKIEPGDKLAVECHWDNTAAMQPVVDGKPMTPRDLNWGESTTDEMCLGTFYVTR